MQPARRDPVAATLGERAVTPHLVIMRALILSLVLALPGAAAAQVHPLPPHVDRHQYEADRHRLEMDRLRARADEQAAFARRQQAETQATLQRLEAARQPPLPDAPRRSVEAVERHERTRAAVTQIDAWLDRRPD